MQTFRTPLWVIEQGFTGRIIDSINRERWYEDGKPVAKAKVADPEKTKKSGEDYAAKLDTEPDIVAHVRKEFMRDEGKTIMVGIAALDDSKLKNLAKRIGIDTEDGASRAALLVSVRSGLEPAAFRSRPVQPLPPIPKGVPLKPMPLSDDEGVAKKKASDSLASVGGMTTEKVLAELQIPSLKGRTELAEMTVEVGKALGTDTFDAAKFEAEQLDTRASFRRFYWGGFFGTDLLHAINYSVTRRIKGFFNREGAADTTDPDEISKRLTFTDSLWWREA